MKRALKLSLSANVVLFALVLCLIGRMSHERGLPPQESAAPTAAGEPADSTASPLSEPGLLQRSRIEPTEGAQSGDQGTKSTSLPHIANNRALDRIVLMPLVFQNVATTAMELDNRQIEVISDLRQKFQEDLGGPDQDPSDPIYRKRWQEAQRENDDLLAGLLGGQFFLDYQLQASNAAAE